MTTLQSLRDALRALTPGTPVTLQVQREGRLMYVSFTLEVSDGHRPLRTDAPAFDQSADAATRLAGHWEF